jgi:hypothetical protein
MHQRANQNYIIVADGWLRVRLGQSPNFRLIRVFFVMESNLRYFVGLRFVVL